MHLKKKEKYGGKKIVHRYCKKKSLKLSSENKTISWKESSE
jgi:hypothetical protein